jgi:hypothetical protein
MFLGLFKEIFGVCLETDFLGLLQGKTDQSMVLIVHPFVQSAEDVVKGFDLIPQRRGFHHDLSDMLELNSLAIFVGKDQHGVVKRAIDHKCLNIFHFVENDLLDFFETVRHTDVADLQNLNFGHVFIANTFEGFAFLVESLNLVFLNAEIVLASKPCL